MSISHYILTEDELADLSPLVAKGEDRDQVIDRVIKGWVDDPPSLDLVIEDFAAHKSTLYRCDLRDDNPGALCIDPGLLIRQAIEYATEQDKELTIALVACHVRLCNVSEISLSGPFICIGCLFRHSTNFSLAVFLDDADFQGTTFRDRVLFDHLTFGGRTSFGGSTFCNVVSFKNSTFHHTASFEASTFGDDVTFELSTFSRDASFWRSTFSGKANFGHTTFDGDANFKRSMFDSDANFKRSTFDRNAGFSGSKFVGEADFGGSKFVGEADFGGSKFVGEASFASLTFDGDVGFRESKFVDDAVFVNSTFGGSAVFQGSTFYGRCFFQGSRWLGRGFDLDDGDLRRAELERIRQYLPERSGLVSRIGANAFGWPQWRVVRAIGSLTALTRVSYWALLVVPILAAVWPAVRRGINTYNDGHAELLLPEVMPLTWALAWGAAVAVALGQVIYQSVAPERVKQTTAEAMIRQAREDTRQDGMIVEERLRAAIDAIRLAAEKLPYLYNSWFVKRGLRTIWLPHDVKYYEDWEPEEEPADEKEERGFEKEPHTAQEVGSADRKRIAIEEGERATYELAVRDKPSWAALATGLYLIGGWFVLMILLTQTASILAATGFEGLHEWLGPIRLPMTIVVGVGLGVYTVLMTIVSLPGVEQKLEAYDEDETHWLIKPFDRLARRMGLFGMEPKSSAGQTVASRSRDQSVVANPFCARSPSSMSGSKPSDW